MSMVEMCIVWAAANYIIKSNTRTRKITNCTLKDYVEQFNSLANRNKDILTLDFSLL